MFKCNLERLNLWDVDKSRLTAKANLGLSVFNAINKGNPIISLFVQGITNYLLVLFIYVVTADSL